MKSLSGCADRSPRVYYSWIWVVLALTCWAGTSRALAQVELSWSPSMVKGPSGAPVTIIEFSDYQ